MNNILLWLLTGTTGISVIIIIVYRALYIKEKSNNSVLNASNESLQTELIKEKNNVQKLTNKLKDSFITNDDALLDVLRNEDSTSL